PPTRPDPEALDFQDELEQVIAEPPPPWLRGPHYLVALLLIGLVATAALTETDIVVVGTGRLVTDSPPLVLQPMDRSIIREILVRPGQRVTAGQVLAVLDPTFARADRAALDSQRQALAAQTGRLEAELAERPLPAPAPGNLDAALQFTLWRQRQAQYATRLQGFDEEIGSQQAGIRTAEEQATYLSQQLAVASDVEGVRAKLLEGQVGSRLQYLGARSQRLQTEQDWRSSLNRATELRHALAARRADRQAFLDEWRRALLEEAVRTRGELARVEESLTKAARLDELTRITAPQDAVVLEVARRSVGSVLREGEALISLTPADVPLIAEVTIGSADIGYTKPGDAVTVKVDAFPFQRHGAVTGQLRAISQESFTRGSESRDAETPPSMGGGAVHRGQVTLDSLALRNLPEGARLTPGMTVSAEIMVGTRSVLGYFLYPITRGLQESIREP
ncbi:HlyD family type I secretion periplasmic adaptor subunit, partial [Roseomonas sp. 18066]|uniref:HlyD family type I secretion periplasmic adaptor subunit n=1 Tax=Roseomonas sp. 18066 TaxID=2681412 RepID=UPI001359641D